MILRLQLVLQRLIFFEAIYAKIKEKIKTKRVSFCGKDNDRRFVGDFYHIQANNLMLFFLVRSNFTVNI